MAIDVGSIGGAIAALKGAADLAKAMVGLHVDNEVATRLSELNSRILDAQSLVIDARVEQIELHDRIRELERHASEREAWTREKERFTLTELQPGVHAYVLKQSAAGGEAAALLCPHCFEDGKKRILGQAPTAHGGWTILSCSSCKFSQQAQSRGNLAAQYAPN